MVDTGLQPAALFLAIFPSILCVLIVAVRIGMRIKGSKYGLEDTLLVIATLLNLVLSVTTCGYILTAYIGYHTRDIPEEAVNPVSMMKWNYANSIIYNPILALVKASFLLTLIKLRSQNTWINCCLWATLVLNGCFAIAAPLACILQCNLIARYWDPTIPGKCVDAGVYTVSTSSIVLATDVLILLMPSWILHDLNMPLGRKLMVIAFLSFGIAVTIVGAVRTSVLVKVFVSKEVVSDPTYSVNYTLSNIESGLAIIGTCGPTIKYLLGHCIPSLKAVDESSNRVNAYPTNGGFQGANRSKRYTRGNKDHDTFYEIDEVELTDHKCSAELRMNKITHGRDDIVITKTMAWQVNPTQQDSSGESNRKLRIPHDIL
ncbi:hypothetical protein ACN47E_001656 [Coniothyrium glycines]